MNYIRITMIAATLAIAAFTPLWSQPNEETLTVDTLCYLGKEALGQSGGALFLPDGNIIALWWGQPLIIDSKTGEVIRKLDSCNTEIVDLPLLTPDGTKLLTRITGAQMAIWDIPTGKIIKIFNFDIGWFCISPDGQKLYTTEPDKSNDKGAVTIYDLNTYQRVERFCDHGFTFGSRIAISPDGQTLAVSVEKQPDNEYDKKTNQVILIDLKDKTKYTVLETLEPGVYSMDFSPDGKTLAFHYNNNNGTNFIEIYDVEKKEVQKYDQKYFEQLFGFKSLLSGHPSYIDGNVLSLIFSKYTLIWIINEKRITKLINFLPLTISTSNNTVLYCNMDGYIGLLSKSIVSVNDVINSFDNNLICKNNLFEFNSSKSFIGQSIIFDTTGKMIVDLGTKQFIQGKNIIRINQQIPVGVYILNIKNGIEQLSFKFMVE